MMADDFVTKSRKRVLVLMRTLPNHKTVLHAVIGIDVDDPEGMKHAEVTAERKAADVVAEFTKKFVEFRRAEFTTECVDVLE
jgi:hypothetical protein